MGMTMDRETFLLHQVHPSKGSASRTCLRVAPDADDQPRPRRQKGTIYPLIAIWSRL